MKKMSIYNKLLGALCLATVSLFSSCSMFDDFLTVYPTNQITGEQFWEDKTDLESVLASCYRQFTVKEVCERMLVWGEIRSDNFILKSESDDDLMNIMNANLLPTNSWNTWGGFYQGIGYCNLVLSRGESIIDKDPSFTEGDWKPMAVECRALRALYYFYLLRTFRDVPFNDRASDTSEGARDPMPQMPQQELLTFLINDLEECKDDGMTNYGNDTYNRGRITKNAVYTLLADLYLWRASKNTCADSAAKYPGMAEQDYRKCIEYCDQVLAWKLEEFRKDHEEYWGMKDLSKTPYPLYEVETIGRITEVPYNKNFGEGNSYESIFEVQYDGSVNISRAVFNFYGYAGTTSDVIGKVGASTIAQDVDNRADSRTFVFSKTDLRQNETVMYKNSNRSSGTDNFQIVKYLVGRVETLDGTNVRKMETSVDNTTYSGYKTTGDEVNWIIYRVSDLMLMKAEAIACLYPDGAPELEEAFDLVKVLWDRANPMIETRDNISFDNYSTASAMQELVMRERHREFFAEGKRWYDLVRMAMRENSTDGMLNLLTAKYTTNATAIKAKLATLSSLYFPIAKDEIKVNPALVQNPAWFEEEEIQRND